MQTKILSIAAGALAATTLLITDTVSAQWQGRQWQPQQIDNPYCSAPASRFAS